MKEIPLTQGKVALVDDEDYEELSEYGWYAHQATKSLCYAGRNNKKSNGKTSVIGLHRQVMRAKTGQIVDHINRNGLDNRKQNLRICSHKQNLWNQESTSGSSKYKGVHLEADKQRPGRKKRWRAKITYNKNTVRLGRHLTEEEAAKAYDTAALKHHGEFARLNFPLDDEKAPSHN